MRGNPDGSLSSRVGCAEALLSFRYIDGINSGLVSPRDDREWLGTSYGRGDPGQPGRASFTWAERPSRVACGEALLSFRYIDGIDSGLVSPRDDWE
jgi:hypothetical protein